jgi:hypothetical protein
MARPPSPYRKTLVEDCEVISVSTATGNLALHGITFEHSRGGRGGQRRWFRCPRCGRRMFKLYRPLRSPFFACRQCHDLTYQHCIRHGEGPWPLLACRAAYVKLGVTGKY